MLAAWSRPQRRQCADLHLGPIQKQDVPIFVEDLSFLQGVIPIPVDGVVGLDLLRESAFVIDYPRRSISFGPLPALPDAIPLVMRDGLAFVQAAVNGSSALLMIDTAAPTLTMFGNAGRNPLDRTVSATTGRGRRIGEFAHEQVVLPSLKLGSAEYGRQTDGDCFGRPTGRQVRRTAEPSRTQGHARSHRPGTGRSSLRQVTAWLQESM